jgi:1-acyl-sn-glycerol-3-phosphate acyltransferase
MSKFFTLLYHCIQRWKLVFSLFALVFLSLCIFVATQLRFEEDITKILPSKTNDITMKVMQQMNFSDKMIVMISAKSAMAKDNLSQIAAVFLDSLRSDSAYFSSVKGKVSMETMAQTFQFVYANLPLFLNESDYSQLQKMLDKPSIDQKIREDYNELTSASRVIARDFILNDPLGFCTIGLNKLKNIGVSKDFILYNGYIHSKDTSTLVLFITPKFGGTDTKNNQHFIDNLYRYQSAIQQENQKMAEISYFGAPFVADANAKQIKTDIQRTVFISFGILILILIFFYRQIYIPIILFIPSVFGVAVALSVLYLCNTTISAISVSIGAILLGITVDYPLHIITHYRESSDVNLLFKNITKPILASSLTTSAAFLCLVFVDSKVLADLGIFAFIVVMTSALVSLVLIPHLYIPKTTYRKTLIDRISSYRFEKNKFIIGLTVLAFVVGLFTFSKVRFNNDISSLNYISPSLKKAQNQFEKLGNNALKSVYLTVYGDSMPHVLNRNSIVLKQLNTLKQKGIIQDFSSLGDIFISESQQLERIASWNYFWQYYSKDSVLVRVQNIAKQLGFNAGAFNGLNTLLSKQYKTISPQQYAQLEALQLDEFFTNKVSLKTLSNVVVLNEPKRQEFTQQIRQKGVTLIDRKELNERFLDTMLGDFTQVTNYSIIAVFLILTLFFRRIELALLNLIPILLIAFVTISFVYVFGLEFNVFSAIVSSLIIGAAVDFSVYMTSGLQKKYTYGKDEMATYRTSIILAMLTSILALGVLIFAKHPAMKSISWVTLIGNIAALLIIFSIYPLLFQFFIANRPQKGKSPVTLRLFVSALLSHTYFAFGSLMLSVLGMLVLPILPFKKKSLYFRRWTSRFLKSVMFTNWGTHNKWINPYHETFEKPAIIIANHSSFLDTLSVGFVPTQIIFLVNDWVYHSPIFGKAVQSAGYYPTSAGIKFGGKKLAEVVKNGASVAIFPEGTRSKTGAINRFHKGAFLLAKEYQIDIVPMYIHGNADLIPKGDFIIYDGTHTIEIGERVDFDESYHDADIKKITKKWSKNFKNHFQKIRERIENPDYFRKKIALNFRYKEFGIEQAAKKEFESNKQLYYKTNPHISPKAKIFRLGDDLGIWDLMLTLQQQNRKVYTYLLDEEKCAIAQQSYLLKSRKIKYLSSPKNTACNVFIISAKLEEKALQSLVAENIFQKVIVLKSVPVNLQFLAKDFHCSHEEELFAVYLLNVEQ